MQTIYFTDTLGVVKQVGFTCRLHVHLHRKAVGLTALNGTFGVTSSTILESVVLCLCCFVLEKWNNGKENSMKSVCFGLKTKQVKL